VSVSGGWQSSDPFQDFPGFIDF